MPLALTSATTPRPYGVESPWNLPIPPDAGTHVSSSRWITRLASLGKPLTSDVDQYTIAAFRVGAGTPTASFKILQYWSDYRSGRRVGGGYAPTVPGLPCPPDLRAGAGTDGQVVIWDVERQLEYGFWQLTRTTAGYTATNGYVASTADWWAGTFPDGKAGRGAGLPYLGGLVTPAEIAAGRIPHALAFAYRYPSKSFVAPASKSDGRGDALLDLPEGARLQLDPSLTPERLQAMGLSAAGVVIARALQEYGMFTVDNSGSSKIYLEDRITAMWPSTMTARTVSALPWSAFRVLAPGITGDDVR